MPEADEKQSEPKSSGIQEATEGGHGLFRGSGENETPAERRATSRPPAPDWSSATRSLFCTANACGVSAGYPVKGTRVTKAAHLPRVLPRQTSHRTNQQQQSYPWWPDAADLLARTPVRAHLCRTIPYGGARSGTPRPRTPTRVVILGVSRRDTLRQVLFSELIRHTAFRCGRNVFDEFAECAIGCLVGRSNPGVPPSTHLIIRDVHRDLS